MRSSVRRIVGGAILGTLVTGMMATAVPAWAHPGNGTAAESDAAHAAQDLVGTPMSQIEKQTRINADRIAKVTGLRPGRRPATTASTSKAGVSRAAVSTDPGVVGKWSQVVNTPVVPIFDAVLPNGKILMWDSVGDGAAESYPNQTFTRAAVWDPVANTSKDVQLNGYNIFCAGFTQLANGNVLVAGGNKDQQLNGIVQTHIFDWQAETWSHGPDMAAGRWYPSVTALANGEASIVGGGVPTTEVYQTNNTIRQLTGFTNYADRLYPFMYSRPDGKLQLVGPHDQMFTVDTAGSGAVLAATARDGIDRDYGSFATYAIGKTLVAGGGNLTEGTDNNGQPITNVPTRTAVVVDTNQASTATVASTGKMAYPRRQHTLTVLADGTVLATGGQSKSLSGLVDLNNAVFAAERWDPATGLWTTLSSATRVREYHSTATLLPDGRVMTGGGGVCGICTTNGYLEKNVEYFTPPYLYKSDGSGALATRPVITSATATVTTGKTFSVTSSQAASIAKVGLVRLGAPTHGDDQSQRYIPLTWTRSGTTMTVTAPATAGTAPPGYYMLFVTDSSGVPSVAKIINVTAGTVVTPPASDLTIVNSNSGRCMDVRGGRAGDGITVQLNTCSTTTTGQQWKPNSSDSSLRSLNNCLDTNDDPVHPGTLIELWPCNGSSTARFVRQTSDGTIRPLDDTTLCVAPIGSGTAVQTALELRTCNGSAAQKWTWKS